MRTGACAILFFILAAVSFAAVGAEETRRIEHADGVTRIPAEPQRIVSLHDSHITLPLIELGAPVVGSAGRLDSGGDPYLRGVRDFQGRGFDDLGLAFLGTYNGGDRE